MIVNVTNLSPIRVVMMRHTGPYEGLSPVFDRLWQWCEAQNVPVQRTIGIYYDNPDYTPANQLRSAACFEVPPMYVMGDRGGQDIQISQIAGGEYATTKFVGPYEQLEPVWTRLTEYVENTLRRGISESNPAFEVYVNDPSDTPPNQLITELYMPLA